MTTVNYEALTCDVYIVYVPGDVGTPEERANIAMNAAHEECSTDFMPSLWEVETVGEDDVVVVRYRDPHPLFPAEHMTI